MPTAASPPVKPRLPSWKGRQMSREGPSPKKTPTLAKAAQFSGLSERSEVRTMTSSAMPVSIHDLAVSRPATPEAHMAVTPRVGPWKSNSWLNSERTVEGMRLSHSRLEACRPSLWW